jgi:glycosyltransferase involved in cell wall biosynthesis
MKKKIIFFCPSIEVGGVEKNLYKVINFLARKEIDLYLITLSKNLKGKFHKKVKIINNNFIDNINYPNFFKIFFCYLNYFLKFGIKKNNIFVSFQSNLYFIILAKLTGNKIVARSNAAPNFYISNSFKKKIFQIIFNLADKIIVNSKDFQKIFYQVFKINPIMIYNPSIDKKNLKKYSKQKIKKVKKNIKFINIGRLTYQKNQILLIKALSQINNLNYKLSIIGNGKEEANLKKYIQDNKLSTRIKIINNVTNANKYFIKNDVFVLSSRYEGLPNVLIEAQLNKKFIISSDCPTGPKEILLNGKAGYLFKNNDINDLKKKIQNYIKNKNKKYIYKKIFYGFNFLKRFDEKKNLQKYYSEIISL